MHRAKSIKHASGNLGRASECDAAFEQYCSYIAVAMCLCSYCHKMHIAMYMGTY